MCIPYPLEPRKPNLSQKGLQRETGPPFLMAPSMSADTSTQRPAQAAACRRNPRAVPLANPELMNPRNLLPVNSLFFGVLPRAMGIRTWQAGLLLPGGSVFTPGEI